MIGGKGFLKHSCQGWSWEMLVPSVQTKQIHQLSDNTRDRFKLVLTWFYSGYITKRSRQKLKYFENEKSF